MAQVKTDNPLEVELNRYKSQAQQLEIKIKTLNASGTTMPLKERVLMIREVDQLIGSLSSYLGRVSPAQFINTGAKFSLENLKNFYQTLLTRWRLLQTKL